MYHTKDEIIEVTFLSLPDEVAKNRPTSRKTGIIMAILLFLAIISVALFTYLNSQNTDIMAVSLGQLVAGIRGAEVKAAKELYNISFDPGEHPAFSVYRDYLVKCSKDGIRLLDKKGVEVWTEAIPLNKPLARTNGKELLIADIGSQDIYVLKEDGILWKDRLDVSIINADISSEGFVTLVTSSKRYKSEVRVYDTHGIELFRSIIANNFVVSAKISPSSRQMAVDSLKTTGIKAGTIIKFFDLNGVDLGEKNLEASDSVFSSIFYPDSGELFAVGDKSVIGFDKDRNLSWEKKFASVSSACLTNGKRLAAVVNEGSGIKLAVYSTSGKELAACPVDGNTKCVNAGGGLIAVSNLREISFYNEKCRNIGKYTSKSDITDVYFFNRQQAAVVTRNQVTVISIN